MELQINRRVKKQMTSEVNCACQLKILCLFMLHEHSGLKLLIFVKSGVQVYEYVRLETNF